MESSKQSQKGRPNFPQLSFRDCFEAALKIYRLESTTRAIDELTFIRHLGYEKITGNSNRLVASLKSYDLVARRKGGYSLTDRAIDVFSTPDYSEFRQLVIGAITMPKILNELTNKYDGKFESDKMKADLIERGFINRGIETIQGVLKTNGLTISEDEKMRDLFSSSGERETSDILINHLNDVYPPSDSLNSQEIEILTFMASNNSRIRVIADKKPSTSDLEKLLAILNILKSENE